MIHGGWTIKALVNNSVLYSKFLEQFDPLAPLILKLSNHHWDYITIVHMSFLVS
jgi:hypothetical protein